MSIVEINGKRFYNSYPSVTTVVDVLAEPWLARWRGKVGNEEADRIEKESSWLGTLVHDTISAHELVGTPIDLDKLDPASAHAVSKYVEWKEKMIDKVLFIETELRDNELHLGGTLDRLVMMKGDPPDWLTLIDFKTGRRSVKHRYQTAGYSLLVSRAMKGQVKRRLALYLPTSEMKGKSVGVVEFTDHGRDTATFLKLLDVFNDLQRV